VKAAREDGFDDGMIHNTRRVSLGARLGTQEPITRPPPLSGARSGSPQSFSPGVEALDSDAT